MADIDTKLLRSFLAVASERSISVAAELCGCSQGTMSLRIQCLEEQLGIRLFERKYRDISLTAEGRDLLPEAQAIVELHDRLIDRASAKLLTGSVRLGIAEGCSVHLISELLQKVQRGHGALVLSVVCENSVTLQRRIEGGTVDLAVVMSPDRLPAATQLSRPRMLWVGSPDFAVGDWDVLPVACHADDGWLGRAASKALQSQGVPYRVALSSANERVILGAVSSGTAIAAMVEGSIPEGLRAIAHTKALPSLGRVRIQLLESPPPRSEAAEVVKRHIVSLYPGS